MKDGGFAGFLGSLLLGGTSLAVAVFVPRTTKKAPAESRPAARQLRLVVREDMQTCQPAATAALGEVMSASPAAVEMLAPAPPAVLNDVEPVPAVPKVLTVEPLPDRGDQSRGIELPETFMLTQDIDVTPLQEEVPPLDVRADEARAITQRTEDLPQTQEVEEVLEPVDHVRAAVDEATKAIQDYDTQSTSTVDAPLVPPKRSLFSRVKQVFGLKRPGLITESDDRPTQTPMESTQQLEFEQPPSLGLDENGTIVERPGEVRPPAEQFAAAGAQLADRIEAQLLAERAAAEEAERKAAEEREEQERQQALDHQREIERITAETEARVRAEAWARFWAVRLDPEIAEDDEKARMKLASSLAIPAAWAGKLIIVALDQDPSERVRARLIGALARGGHRHDPVPFQTAAERTQIEALAAVESLKPFIAEASWIALLIQQYDVA